MALKKYRKAQPYSKLPKNSSRSGWLYLLYLLSSLSLTAGFVILIYSYISPLFSLASPASYLRPVSQEYFNELLARQENFSFDELASLSEDTKIVENAPTIFYLSIPRLGIKNAVVETYSRSASPNTRLGHLRGSALPIEKGEVLIYGHSTTPVMFNPENYRTIFSTLDKVQEGDQITINYNNRNYRYTTRRSEVVAPEEISPVLKNTKDKKLLLVTCFPFGRTDKRFLLYADLVN